MSPDTEPKSSVHPVYGWRTARVLESHRPGQNQCLISTIQGTSRASSRSFSGGILWIVVSILTAFASLWANLPVSLQCFRTVLSVSVSLSLSLCLSLSLSVYMHVDAEVGISLFLNSSPSPFKILSLEFLTF